MNEKMVLDTAQKLLGTKYLMTVLPPSLRYLKITNKL